MHFDALTLACVTHELKQKIENFIEQEKMTSESKKELKTHVLLFIGLLKKADKDNNKYDLKSAKSILEKLIRPRIKNQKFIKELKHEYNRVASKWDVEEGEE